MDDSLHRDREAQAFDAEHERWRHDHAGTPVTGRHARDLADRWRLEVRARIRQKARS